MMRRGDKLRTIDSIARVVAGVGLITLFGCGGNFDNKTSNIDWVFNQRINPYIEIVSEEEWRKKYEEHPRYLCSYEVKKLNTVKVRFYSREELNAGKVPDGKILETKTTTIHSIYIKKGNEDCLKHEFGHIREYTLGLPFHSKYAK